MDHSNIHARIWSQEVSVAIAISRAQRENHKYLSMLRYIHGEYHEMKEFGALLTLLRDLHQQNTFPRWMLEEVLRQLLGSAALAFVDAVDRAANEDTVFLRERGEMYISSYSSLEIEPDSEEARWMYVYDAMLPDVQKEVFGS